jgi:enediyne biosynthesis protein E4
MPLPSCPLGLSPRANRIVPCWLLAAVLLLPACRPATPAPQPDEGPAWFEDVTEESGLDFVHDAGPAGNYFLPQVIGSGAALLDFDTDGRLDVYLLQNGGPNSPAHNRLFHQGADGRFTDVSAGSGLDIGGYNMGVAVGDVNNDGFPDVLVTQYGGLRLFLNNGNGTFTDITREAGLDSPLWGTSAAFFDYDRDGWLDLVVVHYLDYNPSWQCNHGGGGPDFCHPKVFGPTVTSLYHNLGPAKGDHAGRIHFEDVTVASGLARLPGPGLGVACADFDGDGWPDIFVANDAAPNRLWINRHDGTFRDEAVPRGMAYNALGQPQGNMGVALGDTAGSGALFDVFVTHLTEETHTLWKQGPPGIYQDRTVALGLADAAWRGTGFGTVLGDFDQDGALDLALVNGRVSRGKAAVAGAASDFWEPYRERNQLFASVGGKFCDVSRHNAAFCGTAAVSRGLACGDVNGDGALDLLVTTVAGRARLYRNVAPQRGHWLLVRAIDPALHRDAYGARIVVDAGERRLVGWVNPGQSYLCSHDPRVHFGLGPAGYVDALRVRWPDGLEEVFAGQPADRVVELRRGEGRE